MRASPNSPRKPARFARPWLRPSRAAALCRASARLVGQCADASARCPRRHAKTSAVKSAPSAADRLEPGAPALRHAQPGGVCPLRPSVAELLPPLELAPLPVPGAEPPTSKLSPPATPSVPPALPPAELIVVAPGSGAAHSPAVHAAWPGQTAPWQVSAQAPATHAWPAPQVTDSHPVATQCPLFAQTSPAAHARH